MRQHNVVLVDFDGTTINSSKRWERNVKGKEPHEVDWEMWDEERYFDEPIVPICNTVMSLRKSGYNLVFLTAREEHTRRYTERQAADWVGWQQSEPILMREEGDLRPSIEIKRDYIRAMKKLGIQPVLAFEDESAIAAMMREEGIVVAHVSDR